MTVQELIKELQELDEDILDYEVWMTFRIQIAEDAKITGRAKVKEVPENVDVDYKRIYLRTNVKE